MLVSINLNNMKKDPHYLFVSYLIFAFISLSHGVHSTQIFNQV